MAKACFLPFVMKTVWSGSKFYRPPGRGCSLPSSQCFLSLRITKHPRLVCGDDDDDDDDDDDED